MLDFVFYRFSQPKCVQCYLLIQQKEEIQLNVAVFSQKKKVFKYSQVFEKTNALIVESMCVPGLPDGLFSNKKSKFG
jgi:predicted molibdopterin-dependent oxidoreductase YjgC